MLKRVWDGRKEKGREIGERESQHSTQSQTLFSTKATSTMAVTILTNHLKAYFELELVDYFYSVKALLYNIEIIRFYNRGT